MDCFLTLKNITQAGEVDFRARFVDETHEIYANARIHEPPLQHFEICGPCNGIYYLNGYYDAYRLWNPTINEVKVLPQLIMKPDLSDGLTYDCRDTYGFGYDPVTEDYKVVIIKTYRTKKDNVDSGYPSVLVYSLKADSWKYWGDLPRIYDRLENNKTHIFVNGCLYWVGLRWDHKFEAIISFNIVTNVLQEIQTPKYEKEHYTSLGIYKNSVAFYSSTDNWGFTMWTFNEGCWTKKFNIFKNNEQYVYPIGHFKNDMVILRYGGVLVLCDPDTEEVWDIVIDCYDFQEFKSVVVYMESLVSINGLSTNSKDET